MRKNVFGRQLSRDANERKALFKTLASSLIVSERITTTEAKAKAIRPYVEKLVTKVKNRGMDSRKFVEPFLSRVASEKLLTDLSKRFAKRNGGYTRIIKVGNRFFDNAPVVMMEWVEKGKNIEVRTTTEKKAKNKEKPQAIKSDVMKTTATKDTTKQPGLKNFGLRSQLSRLARPGKEKKG